MLTIRLATTKGDRDAIWMILEPVLQAGETYALPRDWAKEDALNYWFLESHEVFLAEYQDGNNPLEIVGTYFIQPNQKGGGSHVANCGYVTKAKSSGKGIARAMCEHSLQYAKTKGYQAMQYNFVVKSNERAVKLWQSLGFSIVGTLPKAFLHPILGYTDVYVMFQEL